MIKLYIVFALCLLFIQKIQAIEIDGSVLLRYENETNQVNIAARKRIRAIAAIGLTSELNNHWSFNAQLRTGSKNKQNVPAITLYQITEQAEGDKDIYISRLYGKAKFDHMTLFLGKIPWKTQQVTDLFWDRHLNPIGIHINYNLGSGHHIKLATFKPLDGARNTVGHMSILQYQTKISTNFGQIKLSPWLVNYQGDSNAIFAKKDTQFDNKFIRLSMAVKQGKWQLGTDIGLSIKDVPAELKDDFSGEKVSYAVELKYGGLKKTGSYLTQLKYLYVERFSVITEFAQNASSPFATSNYKGWDLRVRHKLTKKLWVGGRLSRTKRLVGSPEQSVRFRLETKYMF